MFLHIVLRNIQDRPIMKTISTIVSFLVVAASVLSAQADKTSIYKTKGQSAYVLAFSCSTCACTSLTIDASESSTREGSTTFTSNNINVYFATYDQCGDGSSYGAGSTTFSGFPTNWVKKLGKPFTLNLGVVKVCSFDNGGVPAGCQSVSGSVTITPTSDYIATSTTTCRSTSSNNNPYFQSTNVYNFSSRTASAKATLNVSINGAPISFKDFEVSARIDDSKQKDAVKTVTVPF
jgi:hypothetical protein